MGMTNGCSVSLVADAAEWDALFSRVEHPHMTQSWAYGEAKQQAGGWRTRRLVFERGGEPVAICQLFDKSLAGLRCASRLNRGPLFLDPAPRDDVVRGVYGALASRRGRGCEVLVLAPALPPGPENCRLLSELGFRDRHKDGWRAALVDLSLGEEQLRKNLKSKWRTHLNQAERSGLTVSVSQSPEDVEWMIDRHVENMREKHFDGPAPALVRALYRAAPDDFLVLRARRAGETVGGASVYRFGGTAEGYVAWFGAEGRKVNVGNFLYWHSMLELRRRGCRWFDLGGFRGDEGYGRFKLGVRGQQYDLLHEWLAF